MLKNKLGFGQLSELGVKFLEENIGHLKPVLYTSYTDNLR